jgi:hypothetical protein
MGLFVVGRLALRHGIRVQLRQQDTGGLTAMVLLPEPLLAQSGPAFPGVPGMLQPEPAGTGPALGTGSQFGAPAFGTPALASPTPFENVPRTPVLGADAPGVGAPNAAPFERGPFETFPTPSMGFEPDPFGRNPFGAGAGGRPGEADPFARNPFDRTPFDDAGFDRTGLTGTAPGGAGVGGAGSGGAGLRGTGEKDPFETTTFDANPFDASPFDTNPFDRGVIGETPVDTPWPGHLPPPGSASWPGQAQGGDAWAARPGHGPFEGDDNTGPLPVVRTSPLETEEEFLPIFAAVESGWFRKIDTPGERDESDGEAQENKAWSSPADAGWQAAKAASEPTLGGVTSSGLPKRMPKANLVPGSATAAAPSATPAATAPAPPQPPLSPERVRNRLSSFQQGVRQGRAVARGEAGEEQGYPGAAPRDPRAQDIDKED